jgi:hypothetical protein
MERTGAESTDKGHSERAHMSVGKRIKGALTELEDVVAGGAGGAVPVGLNPGTSI